MAVLSFTQFASLTESTHGTLDDAKNVILALRKHGFVGYLAGGCVRDFLAGHKPKDFDVATNATPPEVLQIFPGTSVVGKSFGVVVCHGIDIATFRKDGKYSDGRHPDEVEFSTDPKDDSDRRDFTVNAMFMDPFTGDILDFHNGKLDAHNKLLRAVGDPNDRFTQDYLRMLRAHRFAAKLNFDIHPDTFAAMKTHAPNIMKMDIERIQGEVVKAMGHDPYRTITDMKSTGILQHVFPEVDSLSPSQFSIVTTTLRDIGRNVRPELGLAAAFMEFGSATAAKIERRLKFTNEEIKGTTSILDLQTRISEVTPHTTMDVLKRLMRDPFFKDALALYKGRVAAHDPHVHPEALAHLTALYGSLNHEDLNPAKFVTGDDLIALGKKPGPDFKRILDAAENGQLTGQIKSKEQALDMIRNGRL